MFWPFLAGSGPELSKCLPSGAFFNGVPAEWGVLSSRQNAFLKWHPIEKRRLEAAFLNRAPLEAVVLSQGQNAPLGRHPIEKCPTQ